MSTIKVTSKSFENEVLKSSIPVIVDFYADWCGPCRMLAPTLLEISNEVKGAKVCKINIDEEPDLAAKYGVMTIPTLISFNNGSIHNQSIGLVSKDEILALIP